MCNVYSSLCETYIYLYIWVNEYYDSEWMHNIPSCFFLTSLIFFLLYDAENCIEFKCFNKYKYRNTSFFFHLFLPNAFNNVNPHIWAFEYPCWRKEKKKKKKKHNVLLILFIPFPFKYLLMCTLVIVSFLHSSSQIQSYHIVWMEKKTQQKKCIYCKCIRSKLYVFF